MALSFRLHGKPRNALGIRGMAHFNPGGPGSDGAPQGASIEFKYMTPSGAPFGVLSRQLRFLYANRRLFVARKIEWRGAQDHLAVIFMPPLDR